jgi:ubiquitin-protein ligase
MRILLPVNYSNYSDGKVCLSLLGTWFGTPEEQWRPYKSTIMQVLVSIQSMLLCGRPFFNEPGMVGSGDTQSSIAYNREVRLQAVRVAICDWMTSAQSQGLWKVRPQPSQNWAKFS